MKKELKTVLVGMVTGVAMTKIGEKVWEKVVAKVLDYTSDNAEKIIDVMNEIKEIGEDEIEVIENTEE